uniref:von Willebrand factor A domain containing 5B2 n=1 Tax=Apteryx owenii TaxID=8824 RepID=A0A8B9QSY0_APTOW
MPGLYALATWAALPLKSSSVKACANGYSLGITARLVYINPHDEPVEGVFIYPLEESEVVAAFEAVAGSRRVTFRMQSRRRAQACCLQRGPSPGRPRCCAGGHLVLDEAAERRTFAIGTGTLGPAESLAVTVSTARELATLPGGALRLVFPAVLTPRVPTAAATATAGRGPAGLCDDSPTSCFGGPGARSEPVAGVPTQGADVLWDQPCNPFPYEFAFELLVKGPCLLAGLESPSHALRADADPWASSAATVCVTLAEQHRYDRNVEIILYPAPGQKPHCPHLVMEEGTMTYQEYEAHIRSRRDYARIASKDSSGERQVMGVTSGVIANCRTAPLPPCGQVPPPGWAAPEPAAALQRVALSCRCFSFGLGPRACRRLLAGMAEASRGRAEFLGPAERLQPKLIKSLKKAMEPAVSDITVDWYVPDSLEALLSPTEIAALYPGDRLVSYCTLYNVARFRGRRPPVSPAAPSTAESREVSLELSAGGTEESERSAEPVSGGDIWKRIYQASYIQEQYVLTHCSVSTDRSQGLLSRSSTSSESTGSRDVAPDGASPAPTSSGEPGRLGTPGAAAPSPPQVPAALSAEELARRKKALARAALAGRSFSSPHGELDAHRLCRALEKVSQKRNQSLEGKLDELDPKTQRLQRSMVDSNNLLSPTHLDWDMLVEPSYLFGASPASEAREPSQGDSSLPLRCQVVIHALRAGTPVSWEVTASLEALLRPRDGTGKEEPPPRVGKAWDKPLHRLAARSVVRDHENAAQREAELEQGFARRFRLKAMQTSKACNVPSLYTCVVPVDGATQAALPAALEVWVSPVAGGCPAAKRWSILHARGHPPWSGHGVGTGPPLREQGRGGICAFRCSKARQRSPLSPLQGFQPAPPPPPRAPRNPRRALLGPQPCLAPGATHTPPLQVQLQQARGPFQLTESFSEVVQIPLDRLRRASPYASHRASLSPVSPGAKSSPEAGPSTGGEEPAGAPEPSSPQSHSTCSEVPSMAAWAQADSGHGSESDTGPHSAAPSEASVNWQDAGPEDLESASWATAVALAWLEHRCAGFFEEWELVAAKADAWLQAQRLPEGVDVGCLKGAARHLFLLLRHWDENIKLNMLCYNPNNV